MDKKKLIKKRVYQIHIYNFKSLNPHIKIDRKNIFGLITEKS